MASTTMASRSLTVNSDVLSSRMQKTSALRAAVPARRGSLAMSRTTKCVMSPNKAKIERGEWSPSSWTKYEAKQQPKWPKEETLKT
eukprot:3840962-Pyramimonas_sp.AAC.1